MLRSFLSIPAHHLAYLSVLCLLAAAPRLTWCQEETPQPPIDDQKVMTHDEEESAKVFRDMLEDQARSLSLTDTEDYSIIQLVDFVMVVRITELLGLNNDESIRLFQAMHKSLDRMHRLKWDRGALHHYLRIDIDQGATDDKIQEKLTRAIEIEGELAGILKQMIEESGKVLTAKQDAQLFLFSFDFESEIRGLIEQAENIAAERLGPLSEEFRPRLNSTPPQEPSPEEPRAKLGTEE